MAGFGCHPRLESAENAAQIALLAEAVADFNTRFEEDGNTCLHAVALEQPPSMQPGVFPTATQMRLGPWQRN